MTMMHWFSYNDQSQPPFRYILFFFFWMNFQSCVLTTVNKFKSQHEVNLNYSLNSVHAEVKDFPDEEKAECKESSNRP